jgi:hypothetical protein
VATGHPNLTLLFSAQTESGYGSQGELHRHGSALSLTSRASVASVGSDKVGSVLKHLQKKCIFYVFFN